jgi:hypothetical protein
MLMNKVIVILTVSLLLSLPTFSQKDSVYTGETKPGAERKNTDKPKKDWTKRITYGGNFSLLFGNGGSFIDVSPLVGYRITDKFLVSVGPVFNYLSGVNGTYRYSTSIYGGRAFAQYFIIPQAYAQVGYDLLNRNNPFATDPKSRVNVENYWVGGGYRQNLGEHVALQVAILYNLNQTRLSPYNNPFFSIGIVGGL